jgi:hypothetical protein
VRGKAELGLFVCTYNIYKTRSRVNEIGGFWTLQSPTPAGRNQNGTNLLHVDCYFSRLKAFIELSSTLILDIAEMEVFKISVPRRA